MKIALFGGTFDPVHRGHIECAIAVKKQLNPDKVIFLPCGEPAHKLDRRISTGKDRIAMLEAALEEYPDFEISDLELRGQGYSFTLDTVLSFTQKYGADTKILYIIGGDSLASLRYWYKYEELIKMCALAVLRRPGYNREFDRLVAEYQSMGAQILTVDMPMVDISSKELRQAVKAENLEVCRRFIPKKSLEVIQSMGLYVNDCPFEESYALANMKLRLKPDRYEHCLRVSEEALRIGEKFGLDKEKCRLAGLLHDCGKGVSMEQLHWLAPELEELADPKKGGNMAIVHGPAGAVIAEKKYGIIEKDILEAIRCHVTGEPDMGPIAQAVFIADYTEPGREGETFVRIRRVLDEAEATMEGLAAVVVMACEESIKYVMSKGQILSPMTLNTRNSFLLKAKGGNI